jgi:poly(3-hydroxybutyrate) depolymerase/surface polysaccharide O-acyltransferase-like enzyme
MEKSPVTQVQKRIHIYEIDLIRAITVFSVVAIHTLAYTNTLFKSKTAFDWINIFGHMLHYNREMFVFVTGLVLTYVYFNKPFSAKKFWLKRFTFVLIPYILWSIFYVIINHPDQSILYYSKLSAWDVLTGDASFQLYYILLALQFYALFPLFLLLLRKIAKYPWKSMIISFVIQIIFLYVDFHFLQYHVSKAPHWQQAFVKFQDRIFLLYQFFFVLGAFAAIYLSAMQKFFVKYGKYVILLFLAASALFVWYSYKQLFIWHEQLMYATSVLQPSVVLYSTVVILFFAYLSVLWEKRKPFYKMIRVIAESSFGIYFVHVLALSIITTSLLPYIPSSVPVLLRIALVLLLAFSASTVFCWILLKTSWLSWTIGKGQRIRTPLKSITFSKRIILSTLAIVIILAAGSVVLINSMHKHHKRQKLIYTTEKQQKKISKNAFSFEKNPASSSASFVVNTPVTSTGCGKLLTIKPGMDTIIGISSGGLHRLYRIYLPQVYNNALEHPLVISFHGYGSNALKQEYLTQFDSLADKNNFIVVYPQGTPDYTGLLGWNTGLHPGIRAKDVLFVSNMLNQIQSNLCVNPLRIYATGFSDGGGFVNLLAFRLSGRIAAFAPVSGSYVSPFRKKLKRAVPIIEFHGTGDITVPYRGNPQDKEFSVNTWVNHWLHEDKCRIKPQTIYHSLTAIGYRYSDCRNDATIVHYKLIGEPHMWPISLFKQTVDKKTRYVTASTLIWQFFKNHPLINIRKLANNTVPLSKHKE